jgi:hypothetical protein
MVLAAVTVLACAPPGPLPPPPGYVSRAILGDEWPLTVEDGQLACLTGKAVVFKHGGRTYALNGTAKGQRKFEAIEPIWQTAPIPVAPDKQVTRLSEPERRRVFAALVACDDRAREQGDRDFPPDRRRTRAELVRGIDHQRRLAEACKVALQRREKLTAQEAARIGTEGGSRGWPPLSPLRKSISPLIQRGLALCSN